MEGRRRGSRRFNRRVENNRHSSLLPVAATTSSSGSGSGSCSYSCCYCDFRIRAFNGPLSRIGQRHAGFLRLWFSVGVAFTMALVFAVTLLLVWLLFRGTHYNKATFFFLFGFSPSVSITDAAYVLVSTLICVSVHEFGHAIAAASEGIRLEYIAVFIATLFPGALVALDYDLLQALPRFSVLRVYCAGIWHNVACCVVCGLALFLMPFILCPFYAHAQGPMILDVPSISPLSGYLSPGDVIVSLDGRHIHNVHDWMEVATLLDRQTLQNSNYSKYSGLRTVDGRKGYCVHNSMIEESNKIQFVDNQSACPNDFTAFVTFQCHDSTASHNGTTEDGQPYKRESMHCLNAKDIVKFNKCGNGWMTALTNGSGCVCMKDESCLSPAQLAGLIWVEITYSRPYTLECLQPGRDPISDSNTADLVEQYCGGTFVFIGDVVAMANSVRLTAYRPRWTYTFGAYLPHTLEKSLMCVFHVSLTLAFLNSLPVYFLDGESILEVALCFITFLSTRKREKVLQGCLFGGTLISILGLLRMLFIIFS